jgi:chorismate mutase / prephenate dehydratase
MKKSLLELRASIDSIDDSLVSLLVQRAANAREIGELKRSAALTMHVPERERQIGERLSAKATEDLPRESIISVFREIMSVCLRLEEPLRVACLGPGTTFSHLAMQRIFGAGALAVSEPTLDLVFDAAEKGQAHYAVVPFENSTEGGVNATLRRLVSTPLEVTAQYYLLVEHNLASLASSLLDVRIVYSHPQALGQARRWLAEHLPHADLRETQSTAGACANARQDVQSAAICSVSSALEHDLPFLARNIHDLQGNETRFLVLAPTRLYAPREEDITSLVFSVRDSFGSLSAALEVFTHHGVNLKKLQSVPDAARPWSAIFWLDADLPMTDKRLATALDALGGLTTSLRVLGSYPTLGDKKGSAQTQSANQYLNSSKT